MFVGSSVFSPKKQHYKMLENKNLRNILMTITMIYCLVSENNAIYPAGHFQGKEKTIVAGCFIKTWSKTGL